jgi:SAM-dependent methyltransferase
MSEPIDYFAEGSLSAALYDFLEDAVQGARGDLAFYLEMAAAAGGPVLDVGTGTGRIAWPLAEAGHEVVGVDLAATMLRRAEAKRARRPAASARVSFLQADMTRLDLGRRFPLVLVPYRSFNHLLTPADQRAALLALRAHLAPGGRAALHLFDPPADLFSSAELFERHRHLNIVHPQTREMLRWRIEERQVDAAAQRLRQVISYRIERADGELVRETREAIEQRWSFQQELRYLFELTGFRIEALYSDFAKSPPASGKEQVWVLSGA